MAVNETQLEDADLVAGMARGDQASLSLLYDRYSPLMFAVGVRILANRAEAEDLVHDVFMEAWRASGTYDRARGSVKTWLLVRLRSRALDRVRSASVTRRVATDGVNLPEPRRDPGPDPSDAPDMRAVRALLATLPDNQRAVLELAYFEGLSSTEISARLGVPVGTVKSRTAAALGKLRDHLSARRGS